MSTEGTKPAEPTASKLPLIVGIPLGVGLFFVMPQGGIRIPASITPWLRTLNIVLLAFHASILGAYFFAMARAFARKQVAAKDVILPAALLTGTLFISLANIFSWLVLAESGPLMGATIVSALFVVIEVICSRIYYRNWRIQQYAAQGNYRAALNLMSPRLRRHDVSFWDLIAAGCFHLRLGQIEEGQRLVEKGLALSERHPVALTHVASAYYIQKRYTEGLTLTDEAIAALGEQPTLLLSRCLFLAELDRVAEAREMWVQVKQLQDPNTLVPKNDRDGQLVLARVKAALGETDASIAAAS
jgi:tetratricopeptide (TPR) repeat protein